MKPYFSSMNDLMQMGGHGGFVWLCYGITFLALAMLIWYIVFERKAVIVRLQRQANHAKSNRLTNKQRKELGMPR